ncbi:HSP20-like chaperone [Flammula alnicola]|nr:HSP20-like chaperone [Flammula alnicola]
MSLARQFFREMRPLFRMLDDVSLARPPSSYFPAVARFDPFQEVFSRPAVDIADKGDKYVIDADLPGVPKDNVEIRIGDGGQSITIEGKIVETGGQPSQAATAEASATNGEYTTTTTLTKTDESATQISSERPFTRNVSFTRTVWLPRPVDAQNVSAKLENGVLTISVNKAEDKASTVVPIN